LPISYKDLIRPFPNLQQIKIDWTPVPETDPRFAVLDANQAESNLSQTEDLLASDPFFDMKILEIMTYDRYRYDVSDRSKIEQMGYLLRQLRFPMLTNFELFVGKFATVFNSLSLPLWTDFVHALQQCDFKALEKLSLGLGRVRVNVGALGIDLCVSESFSRIAHVHKTPYDPFLSTFFSRLK
jgi:hypothetical protein